MTRFTVLALLCLAAAAGTTTAVASASTSSAPCAYKMNGFPVYFKLTGVGTGSVCNLLGQGGSGALVRIYTNPAGPTQCAFQEPVSGAILTVHTSSGMGPYVCTSLTKSKYMKAWVRL